MKLLSSNYLGDYSYSFQGSFEWVSITVTVSLFFSLNADTKIIPLKNFQKFSAITVTWFNGFRISNVMIKAFSAEKGPLFHGKRGLAPPPQIPRRQTRPPLRGGGQGFYWKSQEGGLPGEEGEGPGVSKGNLGVGGGGPFYREKEALFGENALISKKACRKKPGPTN